MHNSTLCYITRGNEVLMLHRVKKKNDVNQDKWIGIGGKFEADETPDECLLREALEETGLTLTSWKCRGVVTFLTNGPWDGEYMYLFTADGFEGTLKECDEGDLQWVSREFISQLPQWEGDRIFLELLWQDAPFFLLKLRYDGDQLVEAVLNGKSSSEDFSKMKFKNRDMLSGPLFSNMILYTIPIILTSFLQLLFNAADLVIVGQFSGGSCVGAVGATSAIAGLLVGFFSGFSSGAGITVGHALGSRDLSEVHKTVHTTLPLALICGSILTVVGVFSAESLLRLMDTPANLLPLATVYMQIYFIGSTFTIVYNYCAAILRASGDTKSPLIFLSISGVLNVALNILFVVVFHMDVAGVAWATVISQAVSAFMVVLTLMRRTDACRLELRKLRIYKKQFLKMLRIGLPSGIQTSLFYIANVIIQSSLNSFGDVFITGNSAATNIEGFASAFINAFQQTAVNFTSQNIGARQYKRVSKILKICYACVGVAGLAIGLLFYFTGPSLLSVYIPDSAEAVQYGMIRLTYICLPYFLCGLMYVSGGALMGTGEAFAPMLISILGVCGLRVGWVYTVFQAVPTPQCLFLSFPVSWAVTCLLQTGVFLLVYKKKLKGQELLSK